MKIFRESILSRGGLQGYSQESTMSRIINCWQWMKWTYWCHYPSMEMNNSIHRNYNKDQGGQQSSGYVYNQYDTHANKQKHRPSNPMKDATLPSVPSGSVKHPRLTKCLDTNGHELGTSPAPQHLSNDETSRSGETTATSLQKTHILKLREQAWNPHHQFTSTRWSLRIQIRNLCAKIWVWVMSV